MIHHVKDLIAHQKWADGLFFLEWKKATQTLMDEEIRKRLDHITMVQWAYLRLLLDEDLDKAPKDLPVSRFEELLERTRENHRGLGDFVDQVTQDSLERRIHIPWFPAPPCTPTVADALAQVAMHTHHHRAQNITRLKKLGGGPIGVDWILWLWKGKPGYSWDSLAG